MRKLVISTILGLTVIVTWVNLQTSKPIQSSFTTVLPSFETTSQIRDASGRVVDWVDAMVRNQGGTHGHGEIPVIFQSEAQENRTIIA